ncbi:hypothetical protein PSACC_02940 [Paramicrosporidium saccamoebae]|uniref:Uncharacterized protein n=1 Tax=Paramicrosporidium saccamoebae TaxID=1246581 RepID=A0A2H9THZ5_9FUNG|nr:hypothetical protein PSACC_02940 [Paramicrosporidium saccamoebae]
MLKNIAQVAILLSVTQGHNVTEPKMPVKPYDLAYMWADYALVFENYPALSSKNLTESTMRDAFSSFIAPLKEYCSSIKDKNVTDAKRKSSVVGMLDQLASPGSFKQDKFNDDDWKTNQMWSTVMKQDTLSKAQKTRNDLYMGIKKKNKQDKAIKQYQKNLNSYRDVMMAAEEKEYKTMITDKAIDWDLYTKRYLELLKVIKKDPAKYSNKVRGYFAVWLHDGNANDDVFKTLSRSASTKAQDKIKDIFSTSDARVTMPALQLSLLGVLAYLMLQDPLIRRWYRDDVLCMVYGHLPPADVDCATHQHSRYHPQYAPPTTNPTVSVLCPTLPAVPLYAHMDSAGKLMPGFWQATQAWTKFLFATRPHPATAPQLFI